jgi:hypothetical protein
MVLIRGLCSVTGKGHSPKAYRSKDEEKRSQKLKFFHEEIFINIFFCIHIKNFERRKRN